MEKWIIESAKLLNQWDKVAAEKALLYLSQNKEKSCNEILMGYALAERIFSNVFTSYISQKETLSSEDEENLELSLQLARKSIPENHPLLYTFLKEVSFIKFELEEEVNSLKNKLLK